MRPDKFTQKMQEALQAAQDVASAFQSAGNYERAFSARAARPDRWRDAAAAGKDGCCRRAIAGRLREELERRPKIQGGRYDSALSNELRATIDAAEKEMAKLKDEFTERRALSARARAD